MNECEEAVTDEIGDSLGGEICKIRFISVGDALIMKHGGSNSNSSS